MANAEDKAPPSGTVIKQLAWVVKEVEMYGWQHLQPYVGNVAGRAPLFLKEKENNVVVVVALGILKGNNYNTPTQLNLRNNTSTSSNTILNTPITIPKRKMVCSKM